MDIIKHTVHVLLRLDSSSQSSYVRCACRQFVALFIDVIVKTHKRRQVIEKKAEEQEEEKEEEKERRRKLPQKLQHIYIYKYKYSPTSRISSVSPIVVRIGNVIEQI